MNRVAPLADAQHCRDVCATTRWLYGNGTATAAKSRQVPFGRPHSTSPARCMQIVCGCSLGNVYRICSKRMKRFS